MNLRRSASLSNYFRNASSYTRSFFRRTIGRKFLCLVLILSLLILPAPGVSFSGLPVLASVAISTTNDSLSRIAKFFKSLFAPSPERAQREKLADRRARVANITISPSRLVAYQDDVLWFDAFPKDSNGQVVQGATFSWSSSDSEKLQIDQSGKATCLQAGLIEITCSAGAASATARVLIRSGSRPPQSDSEWFADQESHPDNTGSGGSSASASWPSSVIDKIFPTAHAQLTPPLPYVGTDFVYDEVWSDPQNLIGSPRNRPIEATRTGSVLPESHNFRFAIPLVSLGGRGLGASLTLYHNSRVWARHGSAITFDPVTSWPSPGFSLGFGRMVIYDIQYNGETPVSCKYLLVDPDGTRRYLGQGSYSSDVTLTTQDGSHISYEGTADGGTLFFNDGTKVTISKVNNRLQPVRIEDSNGNYVSISYKTAGVTHSPFMIDFVKDTMGRYVWFNYNAYPQYNAKLDSISMPGFDGTTQVVKFDYDDLTISNSFSGLTVENLPTDEIKVLKRVYFPASDTGYKLDTSVYGMVYSYSMRREMDSESDDGLESATVSFDYPTTASSLTNAPAFTERTESAVDSPTSEYSYSVNVSGGDPPTKTFIITRPDTTKLELTRSTDSSSVANGLLVKTEIKDISSVVFAKTEIAYANDPGGYPQVQSVTNYDDDGTPTKVDFDYDAYGNITNSRQYGHQIGGQWKVRRRTKTTYETDTDYINAYLRSLATLVETFDALENTSDSDDVLINKSAFTYDDYDEMEGMEDYGGTASPPGHLSSYDADYTLRGNVTAETQWIDLVADTSITRNRKYDIFGNVVKEEVSCCNETTTMVTEDFCWAIPEEITKGDPSGMHLTMTVEPDYNTGLEKSRTTANEQETTYDYDDALRQVAVGFATGASRTTDYDNEALTVTTTMSYDDGGTEKTIKTRTKSDGWGRAIEQVTYTGTEPGSSDTQVNTTYDAMGRVESRTNPFGAGGTPGAETSYEYDALGRVTVTTLPDGDTIETSYDGDEVTTTDQVNRKIKRESDGLGRLVKVTEQNSSGTLSQETEYSYDLLDRMIEVDQGGQLRKYKYDLLGRLLYEKIPEQTATINDGTGTYWTSKFTYTSFNAVDTKTDARGVITTYEYDDLNRLETVSYNTSGASGVATTPGVTYDYGTSGTDNGLLMSVEVGSLASGGYKLEYDYDVYGRVSEVTRWFSETQSYTTSYELNEAGQRKELTYPSSRVESYIYDSKGRLSETADLDNITYNIANQMTGWRIGTSQNNITGSYSYDQYRLQMTNQTVIRTVASVNTTLMDLDYDYEASAGENGASTTAGNAGQLMGVSGTIDSQTESAVYTYDNLRRLVTAAQTTNGASVERRFAYDRWGNRTGVWDELSGGSQIQSVDIEESGSVPTNRLESIETLRVPADYSNDAAGNVTDDDVHSYVYDAENRLVSVNSGAEQYKYDHKNRRVAKTVGSVTTHYVWEGNEVIAEHAASTGNVLVDYVYAGGRMVKKVEGRTTRYVLSDRLSARMMLDTSYNVVGKQSHLPFGEEIATSGEQEKHHFTSYEREASLGLDYAVNRWHSPGVGRFLQADPIAGDIANPQRLNRYAYTINDPINLTDRQGLDFGGCGDDFTGWPPQGDIMISLNPLFFLELLSPRMSETEEPIFHPDDIIVHSTFQYIRTYVVQPGRVWACYYKLFCVFNSRATCGENELIVLTDKPSKCQRYIQERAIYAWGVCFISWTRYTPRAEVCT